MPVLLVLLLLSSMAYAGPELLATEPATGQLGNGQTVYVDDGSCPSGQVKKVTAGSNQGGGRERHGKGSVSREIRHGSGGNRTRECVARPE